jgi:hypothetical protein
VLFNYFAAGLNGYCNKPQQLKALNVSIHSMRTLLLITFLLTCKVASSQQSTLPTWFQTAFKNKKLDQKYLITPFIKTGILQADFNGDKLNDIAVLVTEKATKKQGVLLLHNQSNQYFLFGAGTKFGSGSDNFKWAKGWKIYKEKTASETQFSKEGDIIGGKEIKLKQPGISIWAEEDGEPIAGGIIYWTGQKYIWIHQGE